MKFNQAMMKLCGLQLVLSVLVTLMNLYCVLAGLLLKQLHSMDFYLPLLQSVFDFLISGALSSLFNLAAAAFYMHFACLPRCHMDPTIRLFVYTSATPTVELRSKSYNEPKPQPNCTKCSFSLLLSSQHCT